jgi:hypothetical protein
MLATGPKLINFFGEIPVEQFDKNHDGKNYVENMKHHENPDSLHQQAEMNQVGLDMGNINNQRIVQKGKGKEHLDETPIAGDKIIKPEGFSKWLEEPKINSAVINDKNLSEYTHKFKSKLDE